METSKMCLDLVKEMVEGVGRASTVSMMSLLVGELVERAGATVHLNTIITEIISQGQEFRDQVERRLRSAIFFLCFSIFIITPQLIHIGTNEYKINSCSVHELSVFN